ncbi:MAG TPA: FAD-dependent oxidoreductase [Candidatus Limnocylindria bacterium]|nr:FAD-dependent oxidoreductase [Candidatus Limnocylindria bacterium]
MSSLWLDGEQRAYPSLEGDAVADVAVVGAGIAGVATAYFLASTGAKVVVLEARGVAEAASGRNAGFLLAGVAENFVAASRRYGERNALRIWHFTKRTQALVRSIVAEHGIDCELRWSGSDQIPGDDAEWHEIESSARRLSSEGVAVGVDPAARTATYADDGELHPVRWVRGLAAAAVSKGARIHESTQVHAVAPGEARTAAGVVRAGAVVLCTNAYTAHLTTSRVLPVRGQMLATAPAPAVFARPAYAHRGYRYWRQTGDGRVLVGGWRDTAADVEVGEEERTTETIQRQLEAFLREHRVGAPVTHRWAGTMGFSHDALPYIGAVAPGIFVCGGFTGHGMAFGPASAELVTALVRGETPPDADLFDPSR